MAVVAITQAQRRIPIQSAKHVRGRRVMRRTAAVSSAASESGGRDADHFRIEPADVPDVLLRAGWSRLFPNAQWVQHFKSMFDASGRGFVYNLCYVALIYFFCYFWTAITFNPKDMANNLKDYGSFVPGYRPGATHRRTISKR